jgi:NAD(P)-dependent dehydrogenase (short-subunit alcohol dehydrogenase family)
LRGTSIARHARDQTIHNQFGKLDLLINNVAIAGTGGGSPRKVSIEAVETTMHASYVGTAVVTEAVLSLLQSAGKVQRRRCPRDRPCSLSLPPVSGKFLETGRGDPLAETCMPT